MFNFFCKILQHPKINPGSAPDDRCYSSCEELTSLRKSSPWYSDKSGRRETFSYSWAVILLWRRSLILATLAIFDSVLSILLSRKVRSGFKSILVLCDEESANSVVRNPALKGIEPGCSEERHMHYPLCYCNILINQCEIMVGYPFPY